MDARRFVRAVLVPHRRENPELGKGRCPPDQFQNAVILVRFQTMAGDKFGGDLGLVHGSLIRKIGAGRKGLLWRFSALSRALPRLDKGPGFAQRGWIGFKDRNLVRKAFDVNDLSNTAFRHRPDLHVETDGEFKGWRTWSRDSFESHNGPLWHRMDENGRVQCAFRVEKKHLNGMRNVHGGCFMSFADYCLFAIASSS